MEPFEQRLIKGMRERGYSEEFAHQLFNQIKGFGQYGFPESHADVRTLTINISSCDTDLTERIQL